MTVRRWSPTSIVARIRATFHKLTGHKPTGWTSRAWPAGPLRPREDPIRAELFSIERLEQHAESLAAAQRTTDRPTADRRLERRLRDNDRALRSAYHATIAAAREQRVITPAADWLVDNFHVVEEQVREIRVDFPPGFHRQLPKLADGPLAGHPRVYGLAWAFVAHTDSQFDPQMLCRFVRAYQHVQPLTIGELWAVAITLRIVLVENLRRLAGDIVNYQSARREANELADQLLGDDSKKADAGEAILQRFKGTLPTAFAAQLVQRLRDQDPSVMPALQLAGRAPQRARDHGRRHRPRRAAAPRRGERDDPQCHHQHAADVCDRLARAVRKRQPGRCHAARGERFRRF